MTGSPPADAPTNPTNPANPANPANAANPAATPGLTYAAAGVDVRAGDRAVELMKDAVKATMTSSVFGAMGGFAGMIDASELAGMRRPLLATSTDGVGTKVAIAQEMDIHDTIGQDLVAMVVDDIVVVGARPVLMTDYIACGKVIPEKIASIVTGIARACQAVGVPLLGGETAEHPGLLAEDEYDVAGAATGVVEAELVLGAHRIRPGDRLIAMASSGLHSNGYSLVRAARARAGWSLERQVPELATTFGHAILEPTRLYTAVCLDLMEKIGPTPLDPLEVEAASAAAAAASAAGDAAAVHCLDEGDGIRAFSHITGGGLAANVARVIPGGLLAEVDRGAWPVPPIFSVVASMGDIAHADLEQTLNMGVGMVGVVGEKSVDQAIAVCAAHGIDAWEIGQVMSDDGGQAVRGTKGVDGGGVRMRGSYRLS